MEQQNYQYQKNSVFVEEGSVSKKFFASVFTWMFVALLLSTVAAFFIASTPSVLGHLLSYDAVTGKGGLTLLGYAAVFAPVVVSFLFGSKLQSLSFPTLIGVFVLYSLLMGVSLSFVLLVYSLPSVVGCFAGASLIFVIMAIMGYTTSVDLTKFGPMLMAAAIGIVIISVVNYFLNSEIMSYIIGYLGIAVFTALLAYKVQDLKIIGQQLDADGSEEAKAQGKKIAIVGALFLYITFINLFLSLLRIFGNRK